MAKVHRVKPGDHVPKVATAAGFSDPNVVWDHPDNAELKATRDDFCILNPGDELTLPERKPKVVELATDASHKFVIVRPKVRLSVALRDVSNKPLANVACELRTETATLPLVLDGNGQFDEEIPIRSESCRLVIGDQEFHLLVGHLTPIDSPTGVRSRLNNLGYEAGSAEEQEAEDGTEALADDADQDADKDADKDADPVLQSAIEEFQCDAGLKVTGICDAATQAKLLEAHGC